MVERMDAIILAGGKGTRLAPVVADVPKPLALVAGRPFLDYLADFLGQSGFIGRIIVSSGYLGEQFGDWAEQRSGGTDIVIVRETEPLGTGGALLHALDKAEVSGTTLVMNGDSFAEADLPALLKQHRGSGLGLTMAVTHVDNVGRYGEVVLKDNRIEAFREKNVNAGAGWINAGIYMIEPDTVRDFARGPSSFERDMIPKLLLQGIGAYRFSGRFIDIGTPESYAAAALLFGSR